MTSISTIVDTEKFIHEIKIRPALWDHTSDEYCRGIRKSSWDEIVELFKGDNKLDETEQELFADYLKKKWKAIRGCYTRELNRKNRNKPEKSSRKSEYAYFKLLNFLKPIVHVNSATPTEKPKRELEESSDEEPYPKKAKPNDLESKGIHLKENRINDKDKHELAKEDEDILFLMSLASTLKQVPKNKKMKTKIRMMALLDEALRDTSHDDFESYRLDSDVKVECDLLEINPTTLT